MLSIRREARRRYRDRKIEACRRATPASIILTSSSGLLPNALSRIVRVHYPAEGHYFYTDLGGYRPCKIAAAEETLMASPSSGLLRGTEEDRNL